jgi:predicted phosphodiesterase
MPATKKTPTRIEAERLCREFPDTPTRTLAKKLSASHKCTLEQARSLVRVTRGNTGSRDRKYATVPRDPQPAGWKPKMPESLAEKWEPFDLGNSIRVAVLSDVHIPYHSTVAFESAVKYCKKKKPNVLLINGDFADFYSISRHQKDPAKRDLKHEMQLVQEGLAWLRHEFGKTCRIVLKIGNHEERWQHWLWNAAPEISDFDRMNVKEWIGADKHGVEVVGDKRPIMLGKLPVLHGHEMMANSNAVNPSRGAFMRTLSTVLVGHSHRTSHHTEPNMWHAQVSCWSCGALCELNPQYAVINRWNHGAAFVEVDSAGGFEVENFRIGPDGEIWK